MFSLIELPYALDALEPVISACTLEVHHGKHLKGYLDNLNKLVPGTVCEGMSLEDIVRKADGAVFNNAGQIMNHNMYFEQFTPTPVPESASPVPAVAEPVEAVEGPLLNQIKNQWGSLDAFKADFVSKGIGLFGSGWVWLSASEDGTLVITQESGASNPIVRGLKPLLTFDVWEHAYYLDYQNRRADYLAALWQILDWTVVERRYEK